MAKVTADKLERFRPQTRNANRHTQRGMGQLEASMRKYGYVTPMTAAADGEIIDGSARAETGAAVFGDDVLVVHHDGTKPVIMVRDDIPSADTPEAREISIAANRIAQVNLDFDPEVLLGDLQAGIDLEQFWRQDELDVLLADLTPKTTGDTPAEIDRAEELRQLWNVQPGQLWQLGEHRLICGDCTDAATVARMMGGERAACMWTDPPYGVSYVGKTRDALTIENDGADDLPALLAGFLAAANTALAPGAPFYIAHPAGARCLTFGNAIVAAGWQLHETLVWVKDSMVLGHSDYHYKHEPIYYGWLPGEGRSGRGDHAGSKWYGNNAQVSVFEISRPKRSEEHPTMKPPELVEAMLCNSTKAGDIVYEPFSGSGTTIIACENLSRRCRAVEISAAYVAVALQRWADHTQRTPVLLANE